MMQKIGSKNAERVLTFISAKTMWILSTADAELDATMNRMRRNGSVQRARMI